MPPEKIIKTVFACGQKLCEAFFNKLKPLLFLQGFLWIDKNM